MLVSLRKRIKAFVPNRFRRPAAAWLSRRRTAGTRREFRRLFTAPGLKVAVYDEKLDILRFLGHQGELLYIVQRGEIADAVPWMTKIANHVPQGGVVLDVGGFRGVTAQLFAHRAREVHVFEANPESARGIEQMIRVRGIDNIRLHETAVSDREGTSSFNVLDGAGHSSLGKVTTSRTVKVIDVPTITLDAFLARNGIGRVDFMKVDVEGYEYEVLAGAREALRAGRIGQVFFENSKRVMDELGKTSEPIYHLLIECGYQLFDVDGGAVDLGRMLDGSAGDVLATRQATFGHSSN